MASSSYVKNGTFRQPSPRAEPQYGSFRDPNGFLAASANSSPSGSYEDHEYPRGYDSSHSRGYDSHGYEANPRSYEARAYEQYGSQQHLSVSPRPLPRPPRPQYAYEDHESRASSPEMAPPVSRSASRVRRPAEPQRQNLSQKIEPSYRQDSYYSDHEDHPSRPLPRPPPSRPPRPETDLYEPSPMARAQMALFSTQESPPPPRSSGNASHTSPPVPPRSPRSYTTPEFSTQPSSRLAPQRTNTGGPRADQTSDAYLRLQTADLGSADYLAARREFVEEPDDNTPRVRQGGSVAHKNGGSSPGHTSASAYAASYYQQQQQGQGSRPLPQVPAPRSPGRRSPSGRSPHSRTSVPRLPSNSTLTSTIRSSQSSSRHLSSPNSSYALNYGASSLRSPESYGGAVPDGLHRRATDRTARRSTRSGRSGRHRSLMPLPSDGVSEIYSDTFYGADDYTYANGYPLDPPDLPDIYNYAEDAREAIHNVVEAFGAKPRLDDPADVAFRNHCLVNAIMAVRNLLYVTGVLSPSLPGSLDPSRPSYYTAMDDNNSAAYHELKPYKSKVTIRLTKLATYAVKHNSAWSYAGSASRVESDAAELEKAVSGFVQAQQWPGDQGFASRRLYGLLGPGREKLGLLGGGYAGMWKGMGFVPTGPLEMERGMQHPSRVFGREVVTELNNLRLQVDDRISFLEDVVSQDRSGQSDADLNEYVVEWIVPAAQKSVAQISAFLAHIEDINVAESLTISPLFTSAPSSPSLAAHVSVDFTTMPISIDDLLPADEHVPRQSAEDRRRSILAENARATGNGANGHDKGDDVIEARMLLRTLEAAKQSLYDDGATLLAATQDAMASTAHKKEDWERIDDDWKSGDEQKTTPLGAMDLVVCAIRINLGKIMDSLEFLLIISQAQEDALAPDAIEESPEVGDGVGEPEAEPGASGQLVPETGGTAVVRRVYSTKGRIATPAPPEDDDTPWYLRNEYEKDLVVNSENGAVRGGTLGALVERLTMHDNRDANFNHTFLTTFKSFATVDEVFEALVQRFHIACPGSLTEDQVSDWKQKKQTPIRIRVVNIFKSLIVQGDFLEKDDLPILDRIQEFAQEVQSSVPAAKQLLPIIERSQSMPDYMRSVTIHQSESPPPVLQPKVSKGGALKLLDIDPVELARQLTLMESDMFCKIKKADCLARAKDSTPEGVDSIKQVIATTNKIADWVTDSILRKTDSKRRATIIKHFILTAERCRHMNNFSSMAALISGLNRAPIKRLKRSWEHVNPRLVAQLDDLEKTLDAGKSFAAYKALLHTIEPPCVPFLGVYLTMLTFIHDGNKDFIVKDGQNLINFHKRQMTTEVIRAIKQYQSKPYNLTRLPAVTAYIEEYFVALDNPPDFWEISLEREPREREEYVMAKLLQESGFL